MYFALLGSSERRRKMRKREGSSEKRKISIKCYLSINRIYRSYKIETSKVKIISHPANQGQGLAKIWYVILGDNKNKQLSKQMGYTLTLKYTLRLRQNKCTPILLYGLVTMEKQIRIKLWDLTDFTHTKKVSPQWG